MALVLALYVAAPTAEITWHIPAKEIALYESLGFERTDFYSRNEDKWPNFNLIWFPCPLLRVAGAVGK